MRESRRTMARQSSDSPLSFDSPKAPRPAAASRQKSRAKGGGKAERTPLPRGFDSSAMPDFTLEAERLSLGARFIAGVDEAGRGPLAGPVVAAAVILDQRSIPDGLNDSKKLTPDEREELFGMIVGCATVSLASASAAEIDRFNIRGATLIAMRRALAGLGEAPCHALIDGRDVPPGLTCRATAVVAGDARCLSIAAASIVAKVVRDRMMRRVCGVYSGYGFSRHMGYSTPEHLDAIRRLGPSPVHRMSFRPLRPDLLDAAE